MYSVSGKEQDLGSRGAVPKGPLFSLVFSLHCNKEIMNIAGICSYISHKVGYCSPYLEHYQSGQEVVGYMDIKRSL